MTTGARNCIIARQNRIVKQRSAERDSLNGWGILWRYRQRRQAEGNLDRDTLALGHHGGSCFVRAAAHERHGRRNQDQNRAEAHGQNTSDDLWASIAAASMPGTFFRSSILLNGPLSLRYRIIAPA